MVTPRESVLNLGGNTQNISELSFASVSKRVFVQNHSYENAFPVQVYFHANQTHFHMKGLCEESL